MISIPSSLSQQLHIDDKNLKLREEAVVERRSFITCRGCGGRAENDEYDSYDPVGNKQRVRISRCIEKAKCLAYREVVSEEVSDRAEFKIDNDTVKKYARLCRAHKELVISDSGMSSRYVGFALRRSVNRKLLTAKELEMLTKLVAEKYAAVECLLECDLVTMHLYPNGLVWGNDKTVEEEILEQIGETSFVEVDLLDTEPEISEETEAEDEVDAD